MLLDLAATLAPYLARYGYLPWPPTPDAIGGALRRLATMLGIDPAAPHEEIVRQAKRAATLPRCGVRDTEMAAECAWPTAAVRCYQAIRIKGIPAKTIRQCWHGALGSWAAVCAIRPEVVKVKAGANIAAHAGKIDGAGRVLAYSYMPCGVGPSDRLAQVYDTGDPAFFSDPKMLQAVMAHELGHAFGLPHLPFGNLMAPYADPNVTTPQPGDIAEMVKRYGPPPNPPPAP